MHSRAAITLVTPLAAALALSGCAKKHARVAVAVAPAPIVSGETGLASWYGHPYHGRPAANGEIYDMEKLTAAHRTLPFGTVVRVINLTNQKTVDVRITDRGPFVAGRIIDLSHAAAEAIGSIGPGIAEVRLDILSVPSVPSADNWFAVQAGAFQDKNRAEALRASLEQEYGTAVLILRPGAPALWRVLVGREHTQDGAAAMARNVRNKVGTGFVVRLDSASCAANTPANASTEQ